MLTNVRNAVLTKVCIALSVGMVWAVVARASTIDREYKLGDYNDGSFFELPAEGGQIDSNFGVGNTVDGQFIEISGQVYADHDLLTSNILTGPTYTNVGTGGLSRPGVTTATAWGVNLDGTDDYLFIDGLYSLNTDGNGAGGLGIPTQADNQFKYYDANNDRVVNFDNITRVFREGWVRPTNSTPTGRQDIMSDTDQFTIFISASDGMGKEYWGLTHGAFDTANDGEVTVSTTEVTYNTWHHVMMTTGTPNNDGVLYVDGLAVAIETQGRNNNPNAAWNYNFVLGGGVDKLGNYFTGQLDDWNIGIAGVSATSTQVKTGSSGAAMPAVDYGAFDLGADNQYIKQQLDAVGNKLGDVNLDGAVGQADIDTLKQFWLTTKSVNNVVVGDLATRMNGDLNFDGQINLSDAIMLRNGLIAEAEGSGATFDLSDLVPEPTSVSLAILGILSLVGVRRRRD